MHADGREALLVFAVRRELVEVGRLLHETHAALVFSKIALADRVSLHLVNAVDRLNLHWQLQTLVHDHLVRVALRCGRIRIAVHAHKLFVAICGPLAGRTLFG